jgi:hypothetical protein
VAVQITTATTPTRISIRHTSPLVRVELTPSRLPRPSNPSIPTRNRVDHKSTTRIGVAVTNSYPERHVAPFDEVLVADRPLALAVVVVAEAFATVVSLPLHTGPHLVCGGVDEPKLVTIGIEIEPTADEANENVVTSWGAPERVFPLLYALPSGKGRRGSQKENEPGKDCCK